MYQPYRPPGEWDVPEPGIPSARRQEVRWENLTPHPVNLLDAESNVLIIFGGTGNPQDVLRLTERIEELAPIGHVPMVRKTLGGLPADWPPHPAEGDEPSIYYIVSLAVAQHAQRRDFVVPDDVVRDEQGRILGCRRLAVVVCFSPLHVGAPSATQLGHRQTALKQ